MFFNIDIEPIKNTPLEVIRLIYFDNSEFNALDQSNFQQRFDSNMLRLVKMLNMTAFSSFENVLESVGTL